MTHPCPHCQHDRFSITVPDRLRSFVSAAALACCPQCLVCDPGGESWPDPAANAADPPFERIIRQFPTGDGGIALLLLLQQLDSLALNRSTIESLVEILDADGVDWFLTLDRLVEDPSVDPSFDLARRRDQLEQLLDWA